MCNGISNCLKTGGRFVTVNSNPALDFSSAPSYRKYVFETSVAGPWKEGAVIKWTFYLEDGLFEIENYNLDVRIHEQAFRSAGFREIRWHNPRLSSDKEDTQTKDFWKTFMDHPPITFIECVR